MNQHQITRNNDGTVSIFVVNNHGKPTMVRIPLETAIAVGESLLVMFGIGNPLMFPPASRKRNDIQPAAVDRGK